MVLVSDAGRRPLGREPCRTPGELPMHLHLDTPPARLVSMALGETLPGPTERRDVLILERHGALTVDQAVMDACALAGRLEQAAEVPWRAHLGRTPAPLPPGERRALEEMDARARAESR